MTIIAAMRRAFKPATIVPLRRPHVAEHAPAPGGHGAGTIAADHIDTPAAAVAAVVVACQAAYGAAEGTRVLRLSGLRVAADWRPDTAHEDLVAHSARLVRT